jgi:hypothetical protein
MSRFNRVTGLTGKPRLLKTLNICATFFLVCFSGFFFGQNPVSTSLVMIRNFLNFSHTGTVLVELVRINDFLLSLVLIVFMLWFEYKVAVRSFAQKFLSKPVVTRYAAYLFMLFFILALGVFSNQKFFYFQF